MIKYSNNKYSNFDESFVKKTFWFASYLRQKGGLVISNIGISKYIANLHVSDFNHNFGRFSIYFKPSKRLYNIDTSLITREEVAIYIHKLWSFAQTNYGKDLEPNFKLLLQPDEKVSSVQMENNMINPVHFL